MTNRDQRRKNGRAQRKNAKNERPEASRSATTQASFDQRARTDIVGQPAALLSLSFK